MPSPVGLLFHGGTGGESNVQDLDVVHRFSRPAWGTDAERCSMVVRGAGLEPALSWLSTSRLCHWAIPVDGARGGTRTPNNLVLSEAPLPIGLRTRMKELVRAEGFEPATDLGLKQVPLPLGYARLRKQNPSEVIRGVRGASAVDVALRSPPRQPAEQAGGRG